MNLFKEGKTNWKFLLIVFVLAVILAVFSWWSLTHIFLEPWNMEERLIESKCINSGGKISTSLCCKLTNDFPNSCLIGACGCSPENSNQVKVCDCGEGRCFDGEKCIYREVTIDETANWNTYEWSEISFKYPSNWTVEKTYYQTPAQQAKGEPPENIGLAIFPGSGSTGNDFISIGGHQVSCDPSENHTKCQFVSSISNFVYTDSDNLDILKIFDQMLSTLRFIDTSKCSSTQIEGYKTEEIVKEDLDGDNQQEVIRIYIEDKEDLGNKPIIVKIFSGNEDCPQALFHYQGTGNVVWGTQVFSDFWGDGAKAVLIRDVSYAGGSGSTVNITFLTYRQGQYQIIKGPKFSGHDWRCCKFDGDNGLGKKIIGAEHWWGLNYEYYCAGCTSPLQFIIYTWNGEGYTKTVAGITQNSYGPESIDEILEKEPAVLNPQ